MEVNECEREGEKGDTLLGRVGWESRREGLDALCKVE